MGQAYATASDEHGHVHTFKPTPEELRKLRLQFDDMRTSEGGTLRDSLTKDVFKHNFKRVLKPQYIDKVFAALDIDHDGTVSFREFVMVTHILFDGTDDEKLDYLFKLYDANSDGYLTPEEVGQLMSSSLRSMKLVVKSFGDPTLANWNAPVTDDEQAKKMTEKFVAEADTNKDGKITCHEFKEYAKKHPELLQDLKNLRNIMHKVVRDDVRDEKKSTDEFDGIFDRPAPKSKTDVSKGLEDLHFDRSPSASKLKEEKPIEFPKDRHFK